MFLHKLLSLGIISGALLVSNGCAQEGHLEMGKTELLVLRSEVTTIDAPVLVKEIRGRLDTKPLKKDTGYEAEKVGQQLLADEILVLYPNSIVVLETINGSQEITLQSSQKSKWYTLK